MSYPIYWVPASTQDYVRGRNGKTVIAIVHHRMVGNLGGTDRTFQSSSNRPVSTHFGIGYACGKSGHPTGVHIHQYVDLSDTAFGNGNYDSTGSWDNWGYPVSEINARTVSIEHHDNGGAKLGHGKGVVPESVIKASIWLDRLLTSGKASAIRAAGVRARDDTAIAQLGRMPITGRTLITHHDIAGRLKPYCWLPWADDDTGYPRSRYVKEVGAAEVPLPDTSTETDNLDFLVYKTPKVAIVPKGTFLYDNPDCLASSGNIGIDPGRTMPVAGKLANGNIIVGYVDTTPTETVLKRYFVKPASVTLQNAVLDDGIDQSDVDAAVAAAKAALQTTIDSQAATIATLKTELAQAIADRDAALALAKSASILKEALRNFMA